MTIGYIPGPLDTLSGEFFPHFVHMRENIAALEKRVDIDVITADRANTWYRVFQKTGFFHLLNRGSLHALRKFLNLIFFLAVYLETRRRIHSRKNDVYLLRFSFSNYLVSRYLRSKDLRVLLEVHALAHVEEKEYGQTWAPPFYFPFIRYLEKRILASAQAMTSVSASLKTSLVDLGVKGKKIHVIHNAVDPIKFARPVDPHKIKRLHHLEDKVVIGYVGSFARYHGIGLLIDVAQRLRNKYEDIAFLLVGRNVHGSDNPQEQVSAIGLSHLFTFTGELPHFEIPEHIAAMDVAVIPDFNNYGSPMKMFEYMAMRKAVLAPDVPCIREVIEPGRTGVLFERGNVGEAVRGLETLIRDEQIRHDLGRRAHAQVMAFHTWDRNAERILQILESMTS